MTDPEPDYKTMATTKPPAEVFRAILANAAECDRNRMHLVLRIQTIWGIPLEKAMFVGGWHEFDGAYSDEEINAAFDRHLRGVSI